jgi:hypothetical protein
MSFSLEKCEHLAGFLGLSVELTACPGGRDRLFPEPCTL